jgi:hypothetical protein
VPSELSSRAVVLLHDANVRKREFGVFRLWKELQAHCPSFEFPHGRRLGVLGVGTEAPGRLERLFETSASTRTRIRALYSSLGNSLHLERELGRHRSELERLTAASRADRETVAQLERQIGSMKTSRSWQITARCAGSIIQFGIVSGEGSRVESLVC